MNKVNLSATELQFIINEIDKNTRKLEDSMKQIKSSTQSVGTKWQDEQYDVFKQKMMNYFKQLNGIVKSLDSERDLLKQFKTDLSRATNSFRR